MSFDVIFDDPAKDPDGVAWSRKLFDTLADGGAWGVKRSGLLYRKEGDRLLLVGRMPHDPAMPITAAQLAEQQQADIAIIRRYFDAAGIAIEDVTQS